MAGTLLFKTNHIKKMRTLTITCDCCGREIEEKDVLKVEHYIHVSPTFNRMTGHGKMIDGQMHSISGRTETKDFCLPCYNYLFSRFFQVIKEFNKK